MCVFGCVRGCVRACVRAWVCVFVCVLVCGRDVFLTKSGQASIIVLDAGGLGACVVRVRGYLSPPPPAFCEPARRNALSFRTSDKVDPCAAVERRKHLPDIWH